MKGKLMMDKQNKIYYMLAIMIMMVFLVIIIINAITHSLPHELVECATLWLVLGTPALILSLR